MTYWAAAQLEGRREHLAQHFLHQRNYATYFPQISIPRARSGRRVEARRPLFPGYLFVQITLGWWEARWSPGVMRLISNRDGTPIPVGDHIIIGIQARERDGVVILPKPRTPKPGDPARIVSGPFQGHLALYQGQRPHQRVEVLLALLGSQQRLTLPRGDVELVPTA
jgi:transcriptional antiterminator RfaH